MIRCVAIDDEPLALELLESYIAKTPFLELVGSTTNPFEAMDLVKKENVDLLFMDIQMPELTGIDVASSIDTFRTKVVFVTAFDSYALEGFRVDAIDYLLKPVSYPDFLRSAKKAQRLIENTADMQSQDFIVVKADYRLRKIEYNEIDYLESIRDYVAIHLADNTVIKTLSTLKGIETTLPYPPFSRVHRSFIVNLSKVKVMERNCIVFGKTLIPISEAYREDVLPKLNMK